MKIFCKCGRNKGADYHNDLFARGNRKGMHLLRQMEQKPHLYAVSVLLYTNFTRFLLNLVPARLFLPMPGTGVNMYFMFLEH